MTEPDWDEYPNFARWEFECSCGCGRADMDPDFVAKLQELRDALGQPLSVNSGYRCPEYNASVSHTGENGPHVLGVASDLSAHGAFAARLLRAALPLGFTGFGINQKLGTPYNHRYVHLDMLPVDDPDNDDEDNAPRPWLWSY